MDKKKILLASILKPVNEPRMYKKLGLSLAEFSNVDVHIAGYKPEKALSDDKITFHPLFDFNRISKARFKAGKKFSQFLNELQPDILIVNTFELLNAALIYKNKSNCYLIYDVRENHSLNVRQLGIYPFPFNYILSAFIKSIEKKASKSVDHFILAEECYEKQLPFLNTNVTVIENKYQGELIESKKGIRDGIKFAFTGTAHESTGVFRAIEFVQSLRILGHNAELELTIHAAEEKTYSKLKSISYDWMTSTIQKRPIDNREIINTYKNCNVLLAPYIISEQNRNKFPTKLYDALANGIPLIISENKFWEEKCDSRSPVLNIDFDKSLNSSTIDSIEQLLQGVYKDQNALWVNEKEKLNFLLPILDKP